MIIACGSYLLFDLLVRFLLKNFTNPNLINLHSFECSVAHGSYVNTFGEVIYMIKLPRSIKYFTH